jgi:ADP-ribosylglycohydrolase
LLPTPDQYRTLLHLEIEGLAAQGFDTAGASEALRSAPSSLDALAGVAQRLDGLPFRADWPYVEPNDLDGIRREWAAPDDPSAIVDADAVAPRIEAAFIARVCGCMLGKPFEIDPTLAELREALEPHGEWPLRFYPTERAVKSLKALQGQWPELVRERITHVAPDDDINYTILGMTILESKGRDFTHDDMTIAWLYNLPVLATFGPERTRLLRSGLASLDLAGPSPPNPGAELCGALIRADAYGYACPGRPALAAELAHRDATFTHSRTGVYGTMFVAAAIALALGGSTDVFGEALRYVPQRSRFAETVRTCIAIVRDANDWLGAYEQIHSTYRSLSHCQIHQEIGTLINAVHFAHDTADAICKQVMQGNDTDSFGATAGSIAGAIHGPIDEAWVAPFNDDVHLALAVFHERSLHAIAQRMRRLPSRVLS